METLGHSRLPTSQVQEGEKRQGVKESYNARAAIILGSIHIICGVITMVADIVGIVYGNIPFSTGIWTSVFFIVSGSLAIAGARSANRCLVIATMVMAIITAVSAGVLLIMSSVWVGIGNIGNCYYPDGRPFSSIDCTVGTASMVIQSVTGLAMLICSICSSALTCRATCCWPTAAEGAVHYTPGSSFLPKVPEGGHAKVDMDLLPGQGSAWDGANYQKF